MAKFIKLTDGTGMDFRINADQILIVKPLDADDKIEDGEIVNAFLSFARYPNTELGVRQTPEEIAYLANN